MSRNNDIRDRIYQQIELIVARTEKVTSYSGRIPRIEIDLAKEDVRKLYDLFYLLENLTIEQVTSEQIVTDIKEKREERAPVAEKVDEPKKLKTKEKKEDKKPEEKPPAVKDQSLLKEQKPIQTEAQKPIAVKKPDTEKRADLLREDEPKEKKKTILADRYQPKKGSINDIIAAQKADKSIGSQMQHNPINNLKSSIGINEKFIFTYELFSGDTAKYNEAIDHLNTRSTQADAFTFLEELRNKYHWDLENAAFHKLIDMVNRRYAG